MLKREMKKANMQASIIGLGAEYLVDKDTELVKEVIDTAMDNGINIIDVFMPQAKVRTDIGMALAGKRDKMIIQGHFCTAEIDGQYKRTRDLNLVKASFNDLLERLKTNYIDIGMIHYVDSDEDFDSVFSTDLIEYIKEQKEKGIIKAIGLSSHNAQIALRAIKTGLIDVLMFSINPIYDLQSNAKDLTETMEFKGLDIDTWRRDEARITLYNTCEEMGVGITVMKALGGGRLLNEKTSPLGEALTVAACSHYALSRPGVVSVMVGCQSIDEVLEAVKYENTTEKERSFTRITWAPHYTFEGKCMYCNHCQPCPQGINIAEVTKYLDIAKMHDTVPDSVREHYLSLKKHGSDCVKCKICELNCPFGVKIRANMAEAAKLFE